VTQLPAREQERKNDHSTHHVKKKAKSVRRETGKRKRQGKRRALGSDPRPQTGRKNRSFWGSAQHERIFKNACSRTR